MSFAAEETVRGPRVLVATTSFPRFFDDRAGDFVLRGLEGLRTRGWEVEVLAPADGATDPDGAPARETLGSGIRVRRLRYLWPARWQRVAYGAGIPANLRTSVVARLGAPFLVAAFALSIVARARQADVVHAHWGVLGAVASVLAPLHRRPVVLTVHGSDLHRRTAGRLLRAVTTWAVCRADAVVVHSPQFLEACTASRPRGAGCHLVLHGVAAPGDEEVEAAWRQRRGSLGAPRVVAVGRLVAERRQDLVLRAFAALRQRFPGARLTLVGDGPERLALAALAAELGVAEAVELVGDVPASEVPEHLRRAHAFVSATEVETFGLAVAEAAAWALPAVVTAVGYPATLVAGTGGFVVATGEIEPLIAALVSLFEGGGPESAGRALRRRVEDSGLSWEASSRRLGSVYRSVL